MKRRNREINIFNMSLLDILSGALGAFCFMMLVLFPYYKPMAQQEQGQKGVDPKTYEEAMARVRDLEQRLQSCRAELSNCQDQAKRDGDTVTRLGMRNPITVVGTFTGPNDFDIYVE